MQYFKFFTGGVIFTVLFIVFMAFVIFPGDYHISQSIEITAPQAKVYNTIADLSTWNKWVYSKEELKDAKYSVSDQKTGEGGYVLIVYAENYELKMITVQATPYKEIKLTALVNKGEQESNIEFNVESIDNSHTKVTWQQSGSFGWSIVNRLTAGLLDFKGKTEEVYKDKLTLLKNICED
ncbi:SRPBCC family protein [Chondrinema litorale]|uniref:SRPBCC family protein n=1 Tax=Chondrinema litorale TaxID=2994555 RepID=UPI002543BDE3|nr:SRPBCC family protein [Chondrinema litorale]UZR93114.1 hypothetical protein OQ292_14735 [Chondrinema litorale]